MYQTDLQCKGDFLMKKLRIGFLGAVILALFMTTLAQAQGGFTWDSGFQVQNLSSSTANVVIEYVDPSGTVTDSFTDSIAANQSTTYFPGDANLTAGWSGSVVISSDQEIAAIAVLLSNSAGGSTIGGADYGGQAAGSSTVFIPQVFKGYFGINTWFNVQNTSGSAVTVSVEYKNSFNGNTCTAGPHTIQPKAAKMFDLGASSPSCVPAGNSTGLAAATVSATGGEVVATVVQYSASSLLSYNSFSTAGSTEVVFPFISHRWFGSRTGMSIQNTGGSATDVTVTYNPSAGFPGASCTQTLTIQPGSGVAFGVIPFFQQASLPCGPMSGSNQQNYGFVGSARVTGNSNSQPLVAVVNGLTAGTPNGASYNAFDPSAGTLGVSFPQIQDRFFGINTGINVANVGVSNTNITCTFTGTAVTVTANNVAPGAALTHPQQGAIANGYLGSAVCTSSSQPIVGVVSQLGLGPGTAGADQLRYYEGTNFVP
jgi:hypothetical protein